jgi:hypothetical protein
MGFIGKLPLMLSFYEHAAVRVSCGYCFLYCSTTGRRFGFVVIVVVFNRLLAKFFPFRIDLTAQLAGVYLCCLLNLLLLKLLFVGLGLDVFTVINTVLGSTIRLFSALLRICSKLSAVNSSGKRLQKA